MHPFSTLRILPITIVLTFVPAMAQQPAQHANISGFVVDSLTNEPLEGASVFLPALERGSATNRDGLFRIESLHPGVYQIVIQFLGYQEKRETIFLRGSVEKRYVLAPTTIELPNVLVTARSEVTGLTGSVQSISVLTGSDLKEVRGQTLGQTLERVPGVTLMQTGPSISKPVLRGLHSQRILITNAGVRQEGQQWGGEHAPEIDPFVVSRIEVLRGAASVEYGSDAIGGVIRLEPRPLRRVSGYSGELVFNGFSNNRQGALSGWIDGKGEWLPAFSWRLQGSLRKAADSKAPGYVISNSGFEERDASVLLGYAVDGIDLSTYYSRFETKLGIFAGSHIGNISDLQRAIQSPQPLVIRPLTYDILNPKQEISHDLLSIKTSYRMPSLGRLEIIYGWQKNHRQEFDAHKPYSDSLAVLLKDKAAFDLTLTTYTADLKLHHEPIGSWFGTLGVSGTRQGNVSKGTAILFPNFRAYSGGVFVMEEAYQDPWVFSVGARFDYRWQRAYTRVNGTQHEETKTYNNLSGSAGAIYKFDLDWSLGFNIGTAWRPPSINELYSDGVHHGTAQYEIGNASLRTERSKSVDLTLRNQAPLSRGEVSVFANKFDNYIFALPSLQPTLTIRGAFPTFKFTEVEALLYGFDASWEYSLTDATTAGFSASIVRGENLTTDQPLLSMPADRFRINIKFNLAEVIGLQRAYVDLSVNVVRKQDRVPPQSDYSDPPPGYSTWDLTGGTQFPVGGQTVEMYLSVQNVFNIRYRDYLSRFRYFMDAPGRNIIVRIHLPFGSFEQLH